MIRSVGSAGSFGSFASQQRRGSDTLCVRARVSIKFFFPNSSVRVPFGKWVASLMVKISLFWCIFSVCFLCVQISVIYYNGARVYAFCKSTRLK